MKRRGAVMSMLASAAWLAGCDAAPPASVTARRWPVLPVRDLAGQPATLPSSTAAARLFNLWALWCPPCRMELPSLERLTWALAPQTIDLVAVALAEDNFPVREYLAQHAAGLNSVVLSPALPVVAELDLKVLPQTFLVAPSGTVLARWVGAREWDSPAIRAELDRLVQTS